MSDANYQKGRDDNVKEFNELKAKQYDEMIKFSGVLLANSLLRYKTSNHVTDSNKIYKTKENVLPELNENLPLFPKDKPIKILDFACGTGFIAEILAPYLSKDSELYGIDISENQLNLFNNRSNEIKLKYPILKEFQGKPFDILDNKFNTDKNYLKPEWLIENSFDIIYCSYSYHHFPDPDKFTNILSKYLKKNGYFIILDFYDKEYEELGGNDIDQTHSHSHSHDDSHSHSHSHGHSHSHSHSHSGDGAHSHAVSHSGGIPPAELAAMLESAGLVSAEHGIAFRFEDWFNEKSVMNHMPPRAAEMIKTTRPTRVNASSGANEYLFPRAVVFAAAQRP
ncbi:hypothetical protein B5S32_g642 [[Candida] boidinii]|nr:hypothetical protein B5S32_g642 [[Candida] boidinii]